MSGIAIDLRSTRLLCGNNEETSPYHCKLGDLVTDAARDATHRVAAGALTTPVATTIASAAQTVARMVQINSEKELQSEMRCVGMHCHSQAPRFATDCLER
jgi:hypothetical protein